MGWWMQGTLSRAFQRYRGAVAEQQALRRALTRFRHAALSKAWCSWRWFVARRAERRGRVEACLLRLLHRQQALAWSQWCSYVRHRRYKAAADAYHQRHLLTASLAALRRPLELKPRAEACLRRLLHRRLASAFAGWRMNVAASAEVAARADELARGVVLRICNQLLARAFASLRQHVRRNQRLRQVLLRIQRRHLLAALRTWHSAAATSAERRFALEQVAQAEGRGRPSPKKLVFVLRGQHELALMMQALNRWRAVLAGQRLHRALILRAYKHLYYSLARHCFATLR